jgi:hypothetical protein
MTEHYTTHTHTHTHTKSFIHFFPRLLNVPDHILDIKIWKYDLSYLTLIWIFINYRILAPLYDNEKENYRILTNKDIYAVVKKTHYNRDNKVK